MKYIVEIAKEYEGYFKGVLICGIVDGKFAVDVIAREDLEELNAGYINENYGQLQDDAYQKGFKDGKAVNDKGCGGCKYSGTPQGDSPCFNCSNYYNNNWTANDDKIEVGDEVNWIGDCFIVTRIFQPHNMKEQCDGIDDDGCVYHDVVMDDLEKTGRHFDIDKILEDMRND